LTVRKAAVLRRHPLSSSNEFVVIGNIHKQCKVKISCEDGRSPIYGLLGQPCCCSRSDSPLTVISGVGSTMVQDTDWRVLYRFQIQYLAPVFKSSSVAAHGEWLPEAQAIIQAWIERIPRHIEEIIKLEGGNQYKEGRLKGKEKVRIH
jgi:hypothetical protein